MYPLAQTAQTLLQFFKEVVEDFDRDRCARVAAALSFTTLLALVPLVTVLLSMLSLFPVLIPEMTAGIPRTSRTLAVLDPTTLPSASAGTPSRAA